MNIDDYVLEVIGLSANTNVEITVIKMLYHLKSIHHYLYEYTETGLTGEAENYIKDS